VTPAPAATASASEIQELKERIKKLEEAAAPAKK
jgi:tetrahydromethanopterin S-methyltransferase subunit G